MSSSAGLAATPSTVASLPDTAGSASPASTPSSGSAPTSTSATPVSTSTSTADKNKSQSHHGTTSTTHPFAPLTTHWKTPLSCTWTYVVDESQPAPPASGAVAWLDLEPTPGASTLSCYPDGMFTNGHTGTFSPATCPNGWTTASIMVNTDDPASAATTTALCCSSEYSLDGGHCKRSIPTVLAVPITYNHTASTHEVLTNSTTTLYGATIAVNTICALFQQSDKSILGISDETQISEIPDKPVMGLSVGAKIGIAVGATVLAFILSGAFVFMIIRKRRSGRLSSHELAAIRAHQDYRRRTEPPPPAYDVATETSSLGDNESGSGATRDDEVRVLKAQKAAIQRRLEALERDEDVVHDEFPGDGPRQR